MKKSEMIRELSKMTGATQKNVSKILDAFVELVIDKTKNGEKIQLLGLGTFEPKEVKAREGINNFNGKAFKKEPYLTLKFKPFANAKRLRELL